MVQAGFQDQGLMFYVSVLRNLLLI